MNEPVDMSRFIEVKSDQLNADDLIGTTRTITITRVTGSDGDQPVSIHYEGDKGKPFKPCKTIRRVLMAVWGKYANEYVGKSMTLYRDDRVTFGGLETGGIRVSHMSHMEKEMTIVVMAKKGKKAGVTIKPLRQQQRQDDPPAEDGATRWANAYVKAVGDAQTADELNTFANSKATKLAELQGARADLHTRCVKALEARRAELAPKTGGFEDDFGDAGGDPFADDGTLSEDNPTAQEGPADEQRGEANNDADQPAYLAGIRDLRTKLADAKTLKAVEAIGREWDNGLRLTVEAADDVLMLAVDRDINSKRRDLRAQAEG